MCESHQLAICIVENGIASTQCCDPSAVLNLMAANNIKAKLSWVISKITGKYRDETLPLTDAEYRFLASGSYNDPAGCETKFKLSRELRQGIPSYYYLNVDDDEMPSPPTEQAT